MNKVKVYLEKTGAGKNLPLPGYMTSGAAGVDLFAAEENPVIVKPGERVLLSTGIKIAIPREYEAQIRPRSGLAVKYGITLLNSPGTIDCDYRGEIKVIMINLGNENYTVYYGDRIAQMVLSRCPKFDFKECNKLPETERDKGGFGHTG